MSTNIESLSGCRSSELPLLPPFFPCATKPAKGVTSPRPDLSASEERMRLPLLSAGSTREPSREPAPGLRGQQTKAETSLGAETSLAPGPASPAQKKGPCRNMSSQVVTHP